MPRSEARAGKDTNKTYRRQMPGEMRIKYTDALQCLMSSDPEYTDVDGAKTSFDDFAVLHYNLTPFVHNSVCRRTDICTDRRIY